jgi:hypothetical protein
MRTERIFDTYLILVLLDSVIDVDTSTHQKGKRYITVWGCC